MGISIGLAILPDRIDAGAWAAAYDDVVALLRAWPGGLLRLGTRTVRGRTVRAYHSEIETGEGEERRWKVEGDRATLRTAETHSMYRSLHRYHGGQQLDDALIALWRDCETPVLSSKTQDEPYHLPVLAAAMLIEDRFPCAAVAHGDIDSRDAAKAATWIEAVSGRRVVSPVCLDRSRLLARLDGRVGFHEIQEVVDRLHIKPMSPYEQGKWADLLGLLRSGREGTDDDSLRDLAATGSPESLTPLQREMVHAVVAGALDQRAQLDDVRVLRAPNDARLDLLAALFERSREPLTDGAWDRVESAPSEILDLLLGLILMPSSLLVVHRIRRALFENPALCRYAVATAADAPSLARLRERIAELP